MPVEGNANDGVVRFPLGVGISFSMMAVTLSDPERNQTAIRASSVSRLWFVGHCL